MASVNTITYGSIEENSLENSNRRKKRWSPLFWGLLKILGLFHHKYLVTKRRCFSCHMKYVSESSCGLGRKPNENSREGFQIIDSMMISYECEDKDRKINHGSLLEDGDENVDCEICLTLWWNGSGQSCKYTDEEIGVSGWNHRGSRVLSLFVLLLLLAVSIYNVTYAISTLWNLPEQTTELLTEITFFLFLASNSFAVLCCKIRCTLKEELPFFRWASMLNARFIIKRTQLLDLHYNGLPGKCFLFLCTCWPLINSCVRGVVYLILTTPQEEDEHIRAILTSVNGLLMLETWGIFSYIVYIVRVSFQRHFSLLLRFIQEREGQIDVCRGVLSEVVTDFSCFRNFTNFYTIIMFPVAFIGMVSNLSWEHLVFQACGNNKEVVMIQTIIAVLAWSEIFMGICLLIVAQGAVDVLYLWEDFFRDVIKLHSDHHDIFWRRMIHYMSAVSKKETHFFLVSVIFSVIGVYVALNLHNQDTSHLARSCNVTNETAYP